MRIFTVCVFTITLLSFSSAGQAPRFLASSTGKATPLQNGEDPTKIFQPFDCGPEFPIGPDNLHHADILIPLRHRQVAAQWYIAPVTGRLDTLYFVIADMYGLLQDSIVNIRFLKSEISNNHGPSDGTYPDPCTPWGYYTNTSDSDNGIAAFPEEATDTTWHSTAGGTTPSFPPMGVNIWGVTEFPVHVTPYGINKLALHDVLDLNVSKGDVFFVAMRQQAPSYHPSPDSDATIYFRATSFGVPSPSRAWKFFEHTPSFQFPCGPDSVPGWYDQTYYGEPMMYNWWFAMSITGDPPPYISEINGLGHTLSTAQREVSAQIADCYPAHPESAGVASASILYSINDGMTLSSPMIHSTGDAWSGFIPGQSVGSLVSYRITATDINGNSDTSWQSFSYHVVSIHSNGYRCDTSYECTPAAIFPIGTAIDTSEWFLPPRSYVGAQRGDDGTAGPYSLGGPFVFYGDTMNYAWIGVNGAIALSKSQTDTIDLNNHGFGSAVWDLPYRQHHSRADTNSEGGVPKNFIAPFWSDWIVYKDSPRSTFGHIHHFSDSLKFVVEYDTLGSFDDGGNYVDPNEYRVILWKKSGIIEFQYDDIGTIGIEFTEGTLVGMQCDSLTHPVPPGEFPPFNFWNRSGYPLETRLHNGLCIRYVPIYSNMALGDGWQLVSVSTESPNKSRQFLFPSAVSNAFVFQNGTYQIASDPLKHGVGYWMNFNGAIPFVGNPVEEETVHVVTGWNMVGSIGFPVATADIAVTPPGLTTGAFFGFSGAGYYGINTLQPGNAYWVNASMEGTLYLFSSSFANVSHANRIHIVPINETPPAAPTDDDIHHSASHAPHRFSLEQNYPNPFNPVTELSFVIGHASFVTLRVYDVLGREVATIVNENLQPDEYTRKWDASSSPSGVYYYRLVATNNTLRQEGSFVETRKLVLLK